MYLHIFLFRWKPEATSANRERATREIKAFTEAIPGLLEVAVGPNLASNSGGYDYGGCMKFEDAKSFQAYVTHPLHESLLNWLVPLIEAIELDLPFAP